MDGEYRIDCSVFASPLKTGEQPFADGGGCSDARARSIQLAAEVDYTTPIAMRELFVDWWSSPQSFAAADPQLIQLSALVTLSRSQRLRFVTAATDRLSGDGGGCDQIGVQIVPLRGLIAFLRPIHL